jgi:hypothetical protein
MVASLILGIHPNTEEGRAAFDMELDRWYKECKEEDVLEQAKWGVEYVCPPIRCARPPPDLEVLELIVLGIKRCKRCECAHTVWER